LTPPTSLEMSVEMAPVASCESANTPIVERSGLGRVFAQDELYLMVVSERCASTLQQRYANPCCLVPVVKV
jgi:hypothetical protein